MLGGEGDPYPDIHDLYMGEGTPSISNLVKLHFANDE